MFVCKKPSHIKIPQNSLQSLYCCRQCNSTVELCNIAALFGVFLQTNNASNIKSHKTQAAFVSKNILSQEHFVPENTDFCNILSLETFHPKEHFVLRTFRPQKHFVPAICCPWEHFVPRNMLYSGTYPPRNILSLEHVVPGTFCPWKHLIPVNIFSQKRFVHWNI